MELLEENEGNIAQICVNCKGGLQMFAFFFWHREGWTARNEALLVEVFFCTRDTPYPWFIACDANIDPGVFVKGKWFDEETMIIRVTAADVSTCRSKGHDGTKVERILLCGGGQGLAIEHTQGGRD